MMLRNRAFGVYPAVTLYLAMGMLGGVFRLPAAGALQTGSRNESIMAGGLERHYRIHIPASYDGSKPVPLLLMLHGHGGNGPGFERLTGMSDMSDRAGFIVVYPSAYGSPPTWNAEFNRDAGSVDDDGFFTALLDKLQHDYKIVPKRIYCAGFSAGAMMTYRLGAKLSDRFAAIGVVAGSIGSVRDSKKVTIPNPRHPIPVIHIHGKQDGAVVYDGGPTPRLGGGANHYLSVADSIQFWVNQDHCSPTPQETTLENGNVTRAVYTGGTRHTEVILFSIGNGKHHWPGSPGSPPNGINATERIWEFFEAHPRH